MSKAIKVEDHVYHSLDMLRAKRATFSDVVEGLLKLRVEVMELMNILQGQLRYDERQSDREKEATSAISGRDSLEVSHL